MSHDDRPGSGKTLTLIKKNRISIPGRDHATRTRGHGFIFQAQTSREEEKKNKEGQQDENVHEC